MSAEILKDKRARMDLTQDQIAKKAGVAPSTVWNLEAGRLQSITRRTAYKLASAYEVDVTEIESACGPQKESVPA
jgi:transcriptional regulator with XRE-family HTH domain